MTNEQRDEILVSLSKGMNNLQELIIDTKKELKTELNNFKDETNARFNKVETEVADIKTEVADIKTEVTDIKTEVADIKTEVADIKIEVADIKTEVADIKTNMNNFRAQTQKNFDDIPPQIADIIHTTWRFMARDKKEIIKRLDKHEEEINKLKSYLA